MTAQDSGDYSDYSRHITTVMTGMTVINGFIFTAIISLLTKLEQPCSSASAQPPISKC